MKLSVIAAVAENGVIGCRGDLPWHLSADLKRFKQLTMGHAIVMGRKTWESIGRPLPGRVSIVISRQTDYQPRFTEVRVATNLDDALAAIRAADCDQDEAFVIGGARIYEMSLARADRLLLTRVHANVEGDVWFSEVDWKRWRMTEEIRHAADRRNDYDYSFQTFERV